MSIDKDNMMIENPKDEDILSNNNDQSEPDEIWQNVYNNNMNPNIEEPMGEKEEEEEDDENVNGNENYPLNINDPNNNNNIINNEFINSIIQSKDDKNGKNSNMSNNPSNGASNNCTFINQKNDSSTNDETKKEKTPIDIHLKKEIYFMNIIQNYIVKNSFIQLVNKCIKFNDFDFKDDDKNEKMLKLIRERYGLENFLCLIVKSQRNLQKLYFDNKNKKKVVKVAPVEKKTKIPAQSQKPPNFDVKNINKEFEMMNMAIKMDNDAKKKKEKPKKPEKPEKPKVSMEDLNKQIDDILIGRMKSFLNQYEKENTVDSGNDINEINTSSKKKSKKSMNENDINSLKKSDIITTSNNNNNANNDNKDNILGLSVHLHKDENNQIYKYYFHHNIDQGLAGFYCSDKRCSGSGSYNIENKKFVITSEHSIPYDQHAYVIQPLANEQKLFKEFQKRAHKEAQLFKKENGRSNIFWYN